MALAHAVSYLILNDLPGMLLAFSKTRLAKYMDISAVSYCQDLLYCWRYSTFEESLEKQERCGHGQCIIRLALLDCAHDK